jgi:hypothetical protein
MLMKNVTRTILKGVWICDFLPPLATLPPIHYAVQGDARGQMAGVVDLTHAMCCVLLVYPCQIQHVPPFGLS